MNSGMIFIIQDASNLWQRMALLDVRYIADQPSRLDNWTALVVAPNCRHRYFRSLGHSPHDIHNQAIGPKADFPAPLYVVG
jgi:hypothetical protein